MAMSKLPTRKDSNNTLLYAAQKLHGGCDASLNGQHCMDKRLLPLKEEGDFLFNRETLYKNVRKIGFR
jgi:hypothetical protein